MFSWSQTGKHRRGSSGTAGSSSSFSAYPAQRTSASRNSNTSSAGPVLAQTVQGSIRPPPSSSTYTRQQHIDSYLNDPTLKRSTRKVSADDSTYDTVFQTTSGVALILRVYIGHTNNSSSTTMDCPAMTLVGVKCRHAWLDHNMNVVGYPPIQNEQAWKSSNTNDNLLLGQAVHAVVQHLQLQPPEVLEITDAGLQRLQQQQQTTTNGGVTRRRGSSATTAPPDYNTLFEAQLPTFPSIPTEFHVLQTKSREELRRLLNTESEFRTFLTSTTTYTQTQTLALSTIEENAQVAAANLEEEEKLKTLHASVTASQTSLKTKLSEYEKQEREYHSLTAPPSSKTVMKQLQKAKRQAFEESEELADKWVDSDTAADEMSDFLERFLETRQVHHVRAAKLERLQQQEGGGHLSSSR